MLRYCIGGDITGIYGDPMTVTTDMQRASAFMQFNEATGCFDIFPNVTSLYDVGVYTITVKAEFTNGTFTESYQ